MQADLGENILIDQSWQVFSQAHSNWTSLWVSILVGRIFVHMHPLLWLTKLYNC